MHVLRKVIGMKHCGCWNREWNWGFVKRFTILHKDLHGVMSLMVICECLDMSSDLRKQYVMIISKLLQQYRG